MLALEELRTPRLLLSRPRLDDFEDFARMYADLVVMATLGGVRTRDESRPYLDRLLAHWERRGWGWWTARDLATGQFVGRGGPRWLTIDTGEEVELGYGLMSEFWGRGLATELARESLRVAFDVVGVDSMVSFTLPTNHASQRVMEKVGFVYERDGVWADLPHVFYRLTRERWQHFPGALTGARS
jgi:[ribosomal protein S5]-alanine N-acetyltransferase